MTPLQETNKAYKLIGIVGLSLTIVAIIILIIALSILK